MLPFLCRALILGGAFFALACEAASQTGAPHPAELEAPVRVQAAPRPPELTLPFLERGLSALQKKTGKGAHVLELRATGKVLSLQVELSGKLEQVDYVETDSQGPAAHGEKPAPGPERSPSARPGDAGKAAALPSEASSARLRAEPSPGGVAQPHGWVLGPERVELTGDGPLEANLFSLDDVDLAGIARSFRVARRAVDPLDGRVTSLVVRRFLPFSDKVRARIYVDSPRMSGSIDTNERGVPLKRR